MFFADDPGNFKPTQLLSLRWGISADISLLAFSEDQKTYEGKQQWKRERERWEGIVCVWVWVRVLELEDHNDRVCCVGERECV